jgi:serine/threonine protein kinase
MFGVMMYEIVNAHVLWPSVSTSNVCRRMQSGERPIHINDWPLNINHQFKDLVMSCMSHDPLKRPSFRDIAASLDQLINMPSISSMPLTVSSETKTSYDQHTNSIESIGQMDDSKRPSKKSRASVLVSVVASKAISSNSKGRAKDHANDSLANMKPLSSLDDVPKRLTNTTTIKDDTNMNSNNGMKASNNDHHHHTPDRVSDDDEDADNVTSGAIFGEAIEWQLDDDAMSLLM